MAQIMIFGKATPTGGKLYPVGARVPHGMFTASKATILQNQRYIVAVDENEIDEFPEPTEIAYKPDGRLKVYLDVAARYDNAKAEYEAASAALESILGPLSEAERAAAMELDPRFGARSAEVLEETAEVELTETLQKDGDGRAILPGVSGE